MLRWIRAEIFPYRARIGRNLSETGTYREKTKTRTKKKIRTRIKTRTKKRTKTREYIYPPGGILSLFFSLEREKTPPDFDGVF